MSDGGGPVWLAFLELGDRLGIPVRELLGKRDWRLCGFVQITEPMQEVEA